MTVSSCIKKCCYAVAWNFSHIVGGGGCEQFPLFKRGGGREKFYPVLRGGGRKKFLIRDFPILKPPPPVINDQSLILIQ